MKKYNLLISLFLAYLLLAYSFHLTKTFWPFFSLSLLIMIGLAYAQEGIVIKRISWLEISYGLVSGTLLYLIFALGKWLIVALQLPLLQSLTELYQIVSPRVWWHYLVLFAIIIPGEELFWRGYIQRRLTRVIAPSLGILLSTLLYAAAHLSSGSLLLVIAALVGGVFWGGIYHRTGSIEMAILSHLMFDLLLLVLLPLL
ncbi:CPBP family intramembrane glutamic endopeptidase [Ectobacillus panaciterrae]|uniref:CPBP family intramembrane glutamic endopeptidase n=1 Tax=Ectobacillus panaciterrae TaxID=363872 RepID=UPI000429215D|nr:CPBP family intramembrane glutamic endopeptidase [Ectobacillus panaciterrae]